MPPRTPSPGPRLVPLLSVACLLFTLAPAGSGKNDGDGALAEIERIARDAGIDLEMPDWDVVGGVSVGLGHRSNVRLAAFAPESSGFLRGAADFMAWRLPRNGVEWIALFDGTYDRYFSAEPRGAALAMASAEWRWRPPAPLLFSTSGRFIHQDDYIDASTLESGLGSVRARVQGWSLKPEAQWDLDRNWRLAASLGAESYDYRELPDFSMITPELAVTRALGGAGDVRLALGWVHRAYRDQEQAAEGGRPLPGTRLEVEQRRLELRHEIERGETSTWSLQSKGSLLENRDNGSGWFDYDRALVQFSAEGQWKGWTGLAEAGWMRYTYLVQTAGVGIDAPARRREVWSTLLRVERAFGEAWSVFVEWTLEDNRSNDPFLVYDDHVVLAGFRWGR